MKSEAVRLRKEKLQQEIDKLPPSSLDPDFMEGTFSERLADLTRELKEVENSAEGDLLGNRLEKYDRYYQKFEEKKRKIDFIKNFLFI